MGKHQIKFYPVDNGDTTLITLIDNTTILIDCKIRESEENSEGNKIYKVKDDLVSSLQKKSNNLHLDLFIVTHPDEDHCLGFEKHFFQGDPESYGETNRKKEEIIIDELWITSMVFNGASNEDAKKLKKEAERRRKLWDDNKSDKDNPGNRIRMIGYDGDKKFDNIPNSTPGETVNKINGKTIGNFEFFVHAPFKEHLVTATAEKDQNFSSIAMQARFKMNPSDSTWSCFFLFGGDADHNIWSEILKKSEANNNKEKLQWDIFLSPHHCSWTYFNNVPYADPEENKTPKDSSLKILDYKKTDAKIIASCKLIVDNDDNPPHYQAKQQYVKKVTNSSFLNTASEPKEKEPEPILFEITDSGITRTDKGAKAESFRKTAEGIKAGLIGTATTGKLSEMAENVIKHEHHRFYGE
jgi:hypothetical protein